LDLIYTNPVAKGSSTKSGRSPPVACRGDEGRMRHSCRRKILLDAEMNLQFTIFKPAAISGASSGGFATSGILRMSW
jgi:hypothetical protein